MSWNRYCIRDDYIERAEPAYALDDEVSGFQPHVYTFAKWSGLLCGAKRIVDVGCGQASKLAALYPQFEIVGVDCGENLIAAKARYPFGSWLDVDLETLDPSGVDVSESVVVCADVIEHLRDPSRLVAALRVWMDDAWLGVLSTPERVLCWGTAHVGPPPNPSHVREWTRIELEQYLTQNGLRVTFSGFTQTHLAHPETGAHQGCQTTFVVLQGRKR